MKCFMNRNPLYLILPLLTGCAQLQRPLTDAALGAGGAWAGYELSDGNPAAAAAGAAGGVLLGEGFHAWRSKSEQKAYQRGFQKGRSDGVKQLYFNLRAQHRDSQYQDEPNQAGP